MTFDERIRLIARLDNLIRLKFRGNARDYSRKLDISRATFFRMLNYLKTECGAPIVYSKVGGHYEYANRNIKFPLPKHLDAHA